VADGERTAHKLCPSYVSRLAQGRTPVTSRAKVDVFTQSAVAATKSGCCAPFLVVNQIASDLAFPLDVSLPDSGDPEQ
jgi:hypothetical protein